MFSQVTRYKASLIHLLISTPVAAITVGLLLGLWYPPPYFRAGGADRLLTLIVGTHIILGPLLTLIIFDLRKPELKRDIAVVVVLQFGALIYGIHAAFISRPVYLVAVVDRFIIVSANELEGKDLAKAKPRWRRLSWTGPTLVATERPTSQKERQHLIFSALAGKDIEKYPRYYTEFERAAPELLKRGKPLSKLRTTHPEHENIIDDWIRENGYREDSILWVPLVARAKNITMLLDKNSGRPLAPIEIDPW